MKYCIIPTPYEVKEQDGVFRFRYDTSIVLNEACTENEYFYGKLLQETVKERLGFSPAILKGKPSGKNEIYFEKGACEEAEPDFDGEVEWKIKRDSYKVTISEDRAVISAVYSNGMLYGVQTLRQLIATGAFVLPCLEINDRPAIANRGFYHDATRGRVQHLAEYKRLAERCAYYKLNQLQLYVEHSYMFKDFSEVWRDDTPLTAEDILELDAYCKKLGIELIPSLASFGHLDKVLKTRSFTELCELPDSDKDRFSFRGRMEHHTINMTDPAAWEFIKKMLEEFIPLFSSKQFNLCGDETFDLGKGKSKKLADEIGTHRIYVDFVKKICEFLKEKGLRPMFWGDIIVASPELYTELPKETVCLTWGYSENESDRSAGLMNAVGATQYLCPGVHGWRHLINKSSSAYANVSKMCAYGKKYGALGILNTDWGDYGHVSHPSFSIPGLIYGAEGSWAFEMTEEHLLNEKISYVEYGDREGKIADVLSALGDNEAATWDNIVNIYEFSRDKSKDSLQEHREFFENQWISDVEEKNARLRELTDRLSEMAGRLDSIKVNIIYSYLLHAKGQELMNLAAGYIGKDCFETDLISHEITEGDRKKLASDLEKWFSLYKENWRKTSRESEIYRVQEVIFWYADMLRR